MPQRPQAAPSGALLHARTPTPADPCDVHTVRSDPGPEMWECYVTEPSPDMDPADLRTELHWPIDG